MEQGFNWEAVACDASRSTWRVRCGNDYLAYCPKIRRCSRGLQAATTSPSVVGIAGDWTLPQDQSVGFRWRGDGLDVSVRMAGALALAAVDQVLGASQDKARPSRSLTAVELGVFEYLILDWMTQLRESVSVLPIPVLTQLSSPPQDEHDEGPVVILDGSSGRIRRRSNPDPLSSVPRGATDGASGLSPEPTLCAALRPERLRGTRDAQRRRAR